MELAVGFVVIVLIIAIVSALGGATTNPPTVVVVEQSTSGATGCFGLVLAFVAGLLAVLLLGQ